MKWYNIQDFFKLFQYGVDKVGGAHRWDKTDHELIIIEAKWWVHRYLW